MKGLSLAVLSALMLGASAAQPPVQGPRPGSCCCCDISIPAISCDASIPADDCFCAAVVCPAGAPTIWHGIPPLPRPTPPPVPAPAPGPGLITPCCCCNLATGKTECRLRPAQDCICPAVVCPLQGTMFVKPTAVASS